eukprot:SAG31_NODE_4722_length_3007_cov_2.155089_2_plen_177_part_00
MFHRHHEGTDWYPAATRGGGGGGGRRSAVAAALFGARAERHGGTAAVAISIPAVVASGAELAVLLMNARIRSAIRAARRVARCMHFIFFKKKCMRSTNILKSEICWFMVAGSRDVSLSVLRQPKTLTAAPGVGAPSQTLGPRQAHPPSSPASIAGRIDPGGYQLAELGARHPYAHP